MAQRTAVIAFNLGGPDSPAAVRPFLVKLFSDPMILRMPAALRFVLARLIAWRRAPVARRVYAELGGGSPILANTRRQAEALQTALAAEGQGECRVFVAMRYWHPMVDQVAREVAAYRPETIVLLPLYPQFSTTTTQSFLRVWRRAAAGIEPPPQATRAICCYPEDAGFVRAAARLTRAGIEEAARHGRPRVLFSAHGLPKKIVDAGDPYPEHVRRSCAAIGRLLTDLDFESVVCFQSRVGPLEWIQPYTVDEIRRAGADRVPIVVVPVAFVSEHSETLVELDREYRALAHTAGVAHFVRVPTVSCDPEFITGLAGLVRRAASCESALIDGTAGMRCAATSRGCPLAEPASARA